MKTTRRSRADRIAIRASYAGTAAIAGAAATESIAAGEGAAAAAGHAAVLAATGLVAVWTLWASPEDRWRRLGWVLAAVWAICGGHVITARTAAETAAAVEALTIAVVLTGIYWAGRRWSERRDRRSSDK